MPGPTHRCQVRLPLPAVDGVQAELTAEADVPVDSEGAGEPGGAVSVQQALQQLQHPAAVQTLQHVDVVDWGGGRAGIR